MDYLKFGFDLDGCVVDFITTFSRIAKEKYNTTVLRSEITEHALEKCTDFPEEHISEAINTALNSVDITNPYQGAIRFINKYHSRTELIPIFITARIEREPTIKWLHKWLHPTPWECVFVNDKDKLKVIFDKDIDIYIEDRVKYAHQIADGNKKVFLINRPWNRHANDEHPNIIRVDDWQEIDKIYEKCYSRAILKKYNILFKDFRMEG